MTFHLTLHARRRLPQRGISSKDIELIRLLGLEIPGGFEIGTSDRLRVEEELRSIIKRLGHLNGKRLVVREGHVVTGFRASAKQRLRARRKMYERDLEQGQW